MKHLFSLLLPLAFSAYGDVPVPVETGPSSYNINFNNPSLSNFGLFSIDANNLFKFNYGNIATCKSVVAGNPATIVPGVRCPGMEGQTGTDSFTIFSIGQFGGPPPTDIGVLSVSLDLLMSKTPVVVVNPSGPPMFLTFTVSIHQDGQCISTLPSIWTPGITTPFGTNGILSILLDPSQGGQSFTISCTKPIYNFKGLPSSNSGSGNSNFLDNGYAVMIQNVAVTVATNASPKLTVSDVKFEQVVENPKLPTNTDSHQFDAVKGKSSSFRITLAGNNLSAASGFVVVQVRNSAGLVVSASNSIPISAIAAAIQSQGSYSIPAEAMSTFIPQQLGVQNLTVHIEATDPSSVGGSDDASTFLNVHEVITPKMGLVAVAGGGSIGSPLESDIQNLLNVSTYLSAVYPVSDNSISLARVVSPVSSVGVPINLPLVAQTFIADDIAKLEYKRHVLGLDRLFGVVSENYFAAHSGEDGTTGFSFPIFASVIGSAIVSADTLSLPHELAHTYGVTLEQYKIGSSGDYVYDGPRINGYDALNHRAYTSSPNLSDLDSIWGIMGPSRGNIVQLKDFYWFDNSTYNYLLKNMKTDPDPPNVLITGVLDKSGQFTFGAGATLATGTLTRNDSSGDLTIAALDASNRLLSSVSLKTGFKLNVSYRSGVVAGPTTVDIDRMPVSVTLPYDPNIDAIQISQSGKVLKKTSLQSQNLRGIIDSIPDNAFVSFHACGFKNCKPMAEIIRKDREHLDRTVQRIQWFIDEKRNQPAIELIHLLIKELDFFTSKNYSVADVSELTHQEVDAALNDLIDQLKQPLKCYNHKGPKKRCEVFRRDCR